MKHLLIIILLNIIVSGCSEQKVVDAIIKTRDIVPVNKAVKLFQISTTTFYSWVADVTLTCTNSVFKLCNRTYSSQSDTTKEVKAVKQALMKPSTLHWSIRSVHLKGIRDGAITVSENTMYKINKTLGIRAPREVVKKKKRHKRGLTN